MMEEKIKNIVEKKLSKDMHLLKMNYSTDNRFLNLVVDSEGSLTIGDIASLTKKINKSDDMLDIVGDSFRTEISTPGITSNLEMPFQFKKNIGRTILLKIDGHEDGNEISGEIISADDNGVFVKNSLVPERAIVPILLIISSRSIPIPLSAIVTVLFFSS